MRSQFTRLRSCAACNWMNRASHAMRDRTASRKRRTGTSQATDFQGEGIRSAAAASAPRDSASFIVPSPTTDAVTASCVGYLAAFQQNREVDYDGDEYFTGTPARRPGLNFHCRTALIALHRDPPGLVIEPRGSLMVRPP